MVTEDDIAKFYPHLEHEAQSKAVDVMNAFDAALTAVGNEMNYPSADARRILRQQISQVRQSAISMIDQK